jgi:hypothetical protein
LPREPVFYSSLDYKNYVNHTKYGLWKCCSTWCWRYTYQFFDEMNMWRLVEKNPKETGMLEKNITKQSFWGEFFFLNVLFSVETMNILPILWSIWITIETSWKAKQYKIGANQMIFQNVDIIQIVKSFIIWYIKFECPRIRISTVYIEELIWDLVKKVWSKKT